MRIRSETNRNYAWKNLKFIVVLCVYSGFELLTTETSVKTMEKQQKTTTNHQNHSKPPRKTRKTTIFKLSLILRDSLKMVVFLVFLGGLEWFWWFLVVFLGFYSGFKLLTTKTTVKNKKNHEIWILRDSLKMVVFLVFLGGLEWFWWFVVVFGGFSWFLQRFRALDHQNHCKNHKKTTNSGF